MPFSLCTLRRGLNGAGMIALALSVTGPARAQDYMGMVEAYGLAVHNTLQTDILNSLSRSSGERGSVARSDDASALTVAEPDHEALTFTPSAAVTRRTNERLADTLASSLAPGVGRNDLLAALNGGELQATFRQSLETYGFSHRDLADVMTGHLILLWQVANDAHDVEEPQGYRIIRDNLREALAAAPWPREMDDADKQGLAETLGTGTMMIAARYLEARRTGNSAVISFAGADARDMARQFSQFDLMAFDLTSQGFVAR